MVMMEVFQGHSHTSLQETLANAFDANHLIFGFLGKD
jgi:hypothetical protein